MFLKRLSQLQAAPNRLPDRVESTAAREVVSAARKTYASKTNNELLIEEENETLNDSSLSMILFGKRQVNCSEMIARLSVS